MPKYAGFFLRLLAHFLSTLIEITPIYLLVLYFIRTDSLQSLFASTIQLLALFILPFFGLLCVIHAYLISRFGGSIGYLISGLRITTLEEKPLPFARSLWRQTVGMMLSAIFLGAGFFAILWNKKKQGWHDEFSESLVIVRKNNVAIALVLLVLLFGLHSFLAISIYAKANNSPAMKEVGTYFALLNNPTPTSQQSELISSASPSPSPLPSPKLTPVVKPKPSPTPSPKPSPSPAFIQVKGENFSGRYGDPIPGVRITLRNLNSGATAVYSNSGPKWTMSGLEPGTYQFRFDRVEGFTMKHQLCYESCGAGWIYTWAEGDELSAEINNKRTVLINLVYVKK